MHVGARLKCQVTAHLELSGSQDGVDEDERARSQAC